jgi:hypothetical protein
MSLYGRCIGNSGFPSTIGPIPPRARESGLLAYDDRIYEVETGFFTTQVGFNGYLRMELLKNSATLKYSSLGIDEEGMLSPSVSTDLVEETFEVDPDGNVVLTSFVILNANMTVISNQ